ncbi:hypothetical protein BDZ45DRAFT_759729 [Acephala macrosclerotiorum]|nr:hypothetical protein BDZ45DRAFT_759729 [Acephala macrosclerotiorum]
MANNQEWSTFDYSHEQEKPEEEEEDLVLPELKEEASKRPSESWPLSNSAPPPPDYYGPESYELRHLSLPYAPNPDMEKGLPIAPQDASQAGPSRPSNSKPAQEPPAETSKPKWNRWKIPCLIVAILLATTLGSFGISAIVAWSVDHNETTAQIDSTPESIASTTPEVSTFFSTVPSLTTSSITFTSVSTSKEVSNSISTSTLISVSTSVQPTTMIETTTAQPSTLSVTSIQMVVSTQPTTLVTIQPTTIVSTQLVSVIGAAI